MNDAEKAYQYFVIAVPENEEQAKAYFWARKALQPTLTPPNEWVSVGERLPEKKQDVLMLFDGGNMAVGWWHDSDEYITFWCAYTDDGFYTDCDDMPVYWMPLPKPPTEEEVNG